MGEIVAKIINLLGPTAVLGSVLSWFLSGVDPILKICLGVGGCFYLYYQILDLRETVLDKKDKRLKKDR
jgi:uncharacterized membrane protein YfcA